MHLTKEIVLGMFSAIRNFHSYGLIHSDIKPANFTIKNGRVYLIDYGYAYAVDIDKNTEMYK